MTISKIIFGGLCGILYVFGLLMGWNYQETSVYICIYLWPILCILSAIPILYYAVKRVVRQNKGYIVLILAIIYNYAYVHTFVRILQHYGLTNSPKPDVNTTFNQCYNDLIQIAATCGITYEIVNLVIYVIFFAIIMMINFMFTRIIKNKVCTTTFNDR